MMRYRRIGTICNYDGDLTVKEERGAFYWSINDHDDASTTEEIPQDLYDALIRFENEREKGPQG